MQGFDLIGQVPFAYTLPALAALALCLLLFLHATVVPGRVRLKATPLSFGGRRRTSRRIERN